MERNLVLHLQELVDDLKAGRYRPAPLRQFTIIKGDGKQRVLSALSLRDKLAQRAVLTVLEPVGERLFHNDSFGYRPARNTELAHRRACERIRCGLPWLVDGDITTFFDTIPHRPLQKTLKRYIPDRELLRLIDLWLAEGASSQGFLSVRRGIAQGAVISPILCNLYLHESWIWRWPIRTFRSCGLPMIFCCLRPMRRRRRRRRHSSAGSWRRWVWRCIRRRRRWSEVTRAWFFWGIT
jgi:RNA-directed DNA polymerase